MLSLSPRVDEKRVEGEVEIRSTGSAKVPRRRKRFPPHLPVIRTTFELNAEERGCACGATTTMSVDAVNQYTAFGAEAPDHDLNGNTTLIDANAATAVVLRYDFLNRLREVSSGGVGGSKVEHDYDAEGRRVRTRATSVASMPAVSEFVFDGWEEIEEHVKAASGSTFALARRYVHGRSLDEPVRLENLAFYAGPGTYWFQQSTLGNVAALADSSGAIVERYTYDAYGLPQFETPANVPKAVTASDFGNPYLFHARRYEPALYPLYDFRARFLDPARGRFVQRDPPGVWHDPLNLGRAMAFVGNAPGSRTDPLGLGFGDWVDGLREAANDVMATGRTALEGARELGKRAGNAIVGGAAGAMAGAVTGAVLAGTVAGLASGGAATTPAAGAGYVAGGLWGAVAGVVETILLPGDTPYEGPGGVIETGGNAGTLGGAGAAVGKALAAAQTARAARQAAEAAKRAEAARRAKAIRSLQKRAAEHQQIGQFAR